MIINTNSWHYKFVSMILNDIAYDSCEYIKLFALAIIIVVIGTFAVIMLCIPIAHVAVWIVFILKHGMYVSPTEEAVVGAIMLGILWIISGIFYIKKLRTSSVNSLHNNPPGIWKQIYERVHNRFCSEITYIYHEE